MFESYVKIKQKGCIDIKMEGNLAIPRQYLFDVELCGGCSFERICGQLIYLSTGMEQGL